MNSRKIAVIGTGLVGSSTAFAIANQGVCDELLLIDINEKKAEGEAWDIAQGSVFIPHHMKIYEATYADCKDVDIIVFAAGGAPVKQGQTRLDMLGVTINIADSVITEVMKSGFSGKIIVISNPVDILTYHILKKSKLPKSSVIGTGTSIDTARLKFFLSKMYDHINPQSIDGFSIGEHGDSQTIVWSSVQIGGVPYLLLRERDPAKYAQISLDDIKHKVVRAGWEILDRKGTTYYGIASSTVNIIQAIVSNAHKVIPISTFLDGEYSERDIVTGVPAVIGLNGVEKIIELDLTSSEKDNFAKSNSVIREYIRKI